MMLFLLFLWIVVEIEVYGDFVLGYLVSRGRVRI